MKTLSDRWFRRTGKAVLTLPNGTTQTGFGLVAPWKESQDDLWGERYGAAGRLPAPLYRFVGSLTSLPGAQGAKLTQGDTAYRVLRGEAVTLGDRILWTKALLERWESNGTA